MKNAIVAEEKTGHKMRPGKIKEIRSASYRTALSVLRH